MPLALRTALWFDDGPAELCVERAARRAVEGRAMPIEHKDRGEVSRRDFLRAGGVGLALAASGSASLGRDDRSVILLLLVGGPSQLDSFDPKPGAPAEVRGPFRSIATRIAGVRVAEHLPRLAGRLDRVALVRSMHHDAAPIHETGLQLLQTGRLAGAESEGPHLGSIAARRHGRRGSTPPFAVLPGLIGPTGVAVSRGQSAGPLGPGFDPICPAAEWAGRALAAESSATRAAYGRSDFGRDCLLARRLIEAGSRVVVVNMYSTVFGRVSWDVHGAAPFSTLEDYAATVLPDFDQSYGALLDDLEARGLLETTLVVASGEFGRTPRLNTRGGRDHWTDAWTALVAGGGVRGGQVIGATDARGSEPTDRPVTPAELAATMSGHLGLGRDRSMASARPVVELFA